MKIVIKTTSIYQKEISKLLSSCEQQALEDEIANDPLYWPVVKGTGGIRKARFSRPGMGKRGGGRVYYFYLQIKSTIYMLKSYAKNDISDLTEKQKKEIKKIVEQIISFIGE